MSRLVLLLLIARAIAAPVSVRPRVADRAVAGFHLRFDSSPATPAPDGLLPEFDEAMPDSGLVLRVCYWPAPKNRQVSVELARRVGHPRTTASNPQWTERLGVSASTLSPAGIASILSTDRYLHHALGQQRC